MKIEVREVDGYYDLYVDGFREVYGESLAVVRGVADALRGEGNPVGELMEVAAVIKAARE